MSREELHQRVSDLETNIGSVVLGKPEVVRFCLVALLSGEHLLLEDVPGVGKTLVGKALARSIHGRFCRLQFTPDLLPSDIVGSSVYDAQRREFTFNAGPIFANVVLADEINRAPPRTQSALLEAMSDRQVSADGQTHPLPQPFIVIATQNPYEYEGTYPLPESQLDRFLLRISIGYPDREHERQVLQTHRDGEPVERLEAVVTEEQVLELQRAVSSVRFDDAVSEYLLDIVESTRESDELHVGVSTRGALNLYRAAQAAAFLDGRDFVVPDDVKQLAPAVLAHRVIPKGYVQGTRARETEQLIAQVVEQVPVPV